MINEILYGAYARIAIKEGVDKVVDAVKVTLGPAGRCVVISHAEPSPNGMMYWPLHVTKDGVTVARSIDLSGLHRIGGKFVKEAAQKTMDQSGDGTTTCCVLLQAMVERGMIAISNGSNPISVKTYIEEIVVDVVAELIKLAIPVGGNNDTIRQVATVSSNNDMVLGGLIADAFKQIGDDGVVTIEESATTETYIKVIDGYDFDRGYITPAFINNSARQECILHDVNVLLYDKKIAKMSHFGDWLMEAMKEPLLIICDDMEGEALATFAMNTRNQAIKSCVVKAPMFGEARREAMEDIAAFTGATYISDEKGSSLQKMKLSQLGKCNKVIISKERTVLIGGKGDTEDLLNDLRMNETEVDGQEKEAIQARIAKLTGGVAVLYVGAATETEMKEKKDRADDAVRATKAAISEGIVPGAGTAYIRCLKKLDLPGFMQDVLVTPLYQICMNAGVGDINMVYSNVFIATGNYGYNAKTDTVEDLVEAGIIDPVKVLRCALQNAASSAIMILTSETLIANCV